MMMRRPLFLQAVMHRETRITIKPDNHAPVSRVIDSTTSHQPTNRKLLFAPTLPQGVINFKLIQNSAYDKVHKTVERLHPVIPTGHRW